MNIVDSNLLYVLLRITLLFIILLILTNILEKKQYSKFVISIYITRITAASIAANIISKHDVPYIYKFVGLLWWYALTFLTPYMISKLKKSWKCISFLS